MLPLRLRTSLFSTRTYSQTKFLVNRQSLLNKYVLSCSCVSELVRGKRDVSSIKPRLLTTNKDEVHAGPELAKKIDGKNVEDIKTILSDFFSKSEVKELAYEDGLDDEIIHNTEKSFKRYCSKLDELPTDLYIVLSDLISGHGHVLDLTPFFLQHAQKIYPHLKYKEELSTIGDLRDPANYYSIARSLGRKLHLHYGPTNSGKTYSAMKRFMECKKGLYCAPLKMLAYEIYEKANKENIPCDLVTGDDIKRVHGQEIEANHISCTVEMASVIDVYDVAVIDEIQMLKDPSRGAAWTRALLGIAAKEVHLCGEESALNYIKAIAEKLGEELECHYYKRLTKLYLEENAVGSFKNIRDGDCIICFSRKDIYRVMCQLEKLGRKCAVVYGTLPSGVKAAQTKIFNDPKNSCNTLVATDAVGLGLNLNIRRIVFYRIEKKGEESGLISVSLARQIAGRAGRYGSRFPEGFVTSFWNGDLETLKMLLMSEPEEVRQAGLFPSAEQLESFSYYLPGLGVSELLDVFASLSKTDNSLYFMCDMSTMKYLAEQIKHIPLSVQTAFTICTAPVKQNSVMVKILFTKFAKKISSGEVTLCSYMKSTINWPLKKPTNTTELIFLEEAFDCLDLYLWFANRFPTVFPDIDEVRVLQTKLDALIHEGVTDLVKLFNASDGKEERVQENLFERGILTPSLIGQIKNEFKTEKKSKGSTSKARSEQAKKEKS